ncbi:MAG: hypothetical protein KDD83_00800 [Caldilineaceae bacterium]|nr:hypothetical protein [Caldilineaceae bacterium]
MALALVLSILGLLAANRPGLTAEIGQWLPRRSLPQAVASMNSVIHNDTLYVVGGRIKRPNTVAATTAVYFAGIGPDGTLGDWLQTTSLPEPLFGHAVVTTDTHMYVLGGYRTDTTRPRSNVWRAPFQADGTLGAWEEMKNMPEARNFTRAVVVDNRVYVVGGYQDGGTFGEVFVADLWAGGITQWREILPLPDSVYRHALVAYNGSIYVIGGHLDKDTATVLRGTPDSQGNIGAWVPVRSLPAPRAYHAATVYNGDLVVLGGESNGAVLDTVIAAPFQADGGLGDWVALANLPQRMERFGAATLTRTGGDTIYVSGGLLGDLFYATVFASGLPPTPTPTPTATWTPTPQPPAALAVVLENTPDQWVAPGETIDYTIYYRNDGAGALESVSVDGPVPEHAELVEEAIDDGDADGHTLVTQGSRTLVRWTFSTFGRGRGRHAPLPGAPDVTGRRAHSLRAGDRQGRPRHRRSRHDHPVHVDRHQPGAADRDGPAGGRHHARGSHVCGRRRRSAGRRRGPVDGVRVGPGGEPHVHLRGDGCADRGQPSLPGHHRRGGERNRRRHGHHAPGRHGAAAGRGPGHH